MTKQYWYQANQKLIAKAVSELDFEEMFEFDHKTTIGKGIERIALVLNNVRWKFDAQKNIWGTYNPILGSIINDNTNNPTISRFLVDLQSTIKINDIDLSGLIEEMNQTLFSELERVKILEHVTASDIVNCNETQRQRYLDAHPKLIANKGRLGWGEDELQRYSPETSVGFQLRYLAVHRSLCHSGFREDLGSDDLIKATMSPSDYADMRAQLPKGNEADYLMIAIHPWQYQRFIRIQFQDYFEGGQFIDLGFSQALWQPQQSIRTLSALSSTTQFDIKTAVTILNTSCYRGIPGKYIQQGAAISKWLANVTKSDPLLHSLGLKVQQELGGIFVSHPYQSKIEGAYRYNEMLGCIWRERAESVISSTQRPMAMATLMQDDGKGNACVLALIDASGLSHEQWLSKLFRHVVIPLYHLMCQYGVGLVAHGQNVTLTLEDNQPVGCIIKDFHGDLRLVDEDFPELNSLDDAIKQNLSRLPAKYLVHDLLTGHFVTVLRFISPWFEQEGISETKFYGLLAKEIQRYQADHPDLSSRFAAFNLLSERIDKVCLNRVKFKIGYGESNQRPLPELGEPIMNPLVVGLREQDN